MMSKSVFNIYPCLFESCIGLYLLPHHRPRWQRSAEWLERRMSDKGGGGVGVGHVPSLPLIWKCITHTFFSPPTCTTEHRTHLLAIRPSSSPEMAFLCIPQILLHQGGCTNMGVHEAHTHTHTNKLTSRAPKTQKWSITVLTVLPKRYLANNYSECTSSSDTDNTLRLHYKTHKSPSFISWAANAPSRMSENPTGILPVHRFYSHMWCDDLAQSVDLLRRERQLVVVTN